MKRDSEYTDIQRVERPCHHDRFVRIISRFSDFDGQGEQSRAVFRRGIDPVAPKFPPHHSMPGFVNKLGTEYSGNDDDRVSLTIVDLRCPTINAAEVRSPQWCA